MDAAEATFINFAKGLIPSNHQPDPDTLRQAKEWYIKFAGDHAVNMADIDLVEIYSELH